MGNAVRQIPPNDNSSPRRKPKLDVVRAPSAGVSPASLLAPPVDLVPESPWRRIDRLLRAVWIVLCPAQIIYGATSLLAVWPELSLADRTLTPQVLQTLPGHVSNLAVRVECLGVMLLVTCCLWLARQWLSTKDRAFQVRKGVEAARELAETVH